MNGRKKLKVSPRRSRRRARRLSATLLFLLASSPGWVSSAGPASGGSPRAAAVVASIDGRVWIEGGGEGGRKAASVGLSLRIGERVVCEESSAATLYFSGGRVVRVPGGNELEIASDSASAARGAGVVHMSDASLKILEDGLWVLSDPGGDMLVGPMRRTTLGTAEKHVLLSPRWETITGRRPRFVWSSDEPEVRIVVGQSGDVTWRSEPLRDRTSVVGDDVPALEPGETYSWWLERATGGDPLAEPVSFRVLDLEAERSTSAFESEMRDLSALEDGQAASAFLRCAFYGRLGAWTRVLQEADALAGTEAGHELGRRMLGMAGAQMRLEEPMVRRLVAAPTSPLAEERTPEP